MAATPSRQSSASSIRAGEHDRALEAIEYLLSRLPPLDVGVLRLDPIHDSLRDDPRFIALLNESG